MLDLNLIPLSYSDGQPQADLPGLFAAGGPRRPARGRAGDLIVMLISLQNGASFPPGELKKLINQMVQAYYQIPGTVTTAFRGVVELLSQALLDRNLHNPATGRQGPALLNLAAIHGNQVYLAHSGPTHSYVISPRGLEHFTDPQLAGRGLGLSRTVSIHYYQTEIETGSSLIFCPEPPMAWNASLLSGTATLSSENLRRRLVDQANPNLSAAVIQFQDGNGKINLNGKPFTGSTLTPRMPSTTPDLGSQLAAIEGKDAPDSKSTPTESPTVSPVTNPPVQAVKPTNQTPAPLSNIASSEATRANPSRADNAPAKPDSISPASQASAKASLPQTARSPDTENTLTPASSPVGSINDGETMRSKTRASTIRQAHAKPGPVSDEPVIQEMKIGRRKQFPWNRVAPYWKWLQKARQRVGEFFQSAFVRLMPASSEPEIHQSATSEVFIAIAVPLLISAIGLVVYLQKGQNDQYVYNFAQAQSTAQEAAAGTDPQTVRVDWTSTLYWLEIADRYKVTNDSAALRQQAQDALDKMDSVVRLTFQSALVTNLPATTSITRILTVANDLYLLDSAQGSVIRATLTGQGYQIDTAFKCSPGPNGNLIISPLVDMIALPLNNPLKATIEGIDKAGNILFCTPGAPSAAMSSGLNPPSDQWGKITTMTMDNNQLYVLDPRTNIGVYAINQDGAINTQPDLFFQNAPAMSDVVDMTVNTQDLYMVHTDGHMTLCTFSPVGAEATRCTDPSPYSDPRPGNDPHPNTFPSTNFSRIEFTNPPDPSIYLLDPNTATIYHFSLRLNLQRLLRPQPMAGFQLPRGQATAFYISENRTVFMAFGSQVLLSYLP